MLVPPRGPISSIIPLIASLFSPTRAGPAEALGASRVGQRGVVHGEAATRVGGVLAGELAPGERPAAGGEVLPAARPDAAEAAAVLRRAGRRTARAAARACGATSAS